MGREGNVVPTLARSHFPNSAHPTLSDVTLQPALENSGPWVFLEAKELAGGLGET